MEKPSSKKEVRRREYRWTLAAAILLSLATLSSAWCSFQASTWNGVYSTESRSGTAARLEAARESAVADRQLSLDVMVYALWVEATVRGDDLLATAVEARFTPHFVEAFDAWAAQPPGPDGLPAGTPFAQDEYQLPTLGAADAAFQRAEEAVAQADEAGATANRYVLTTVLYASVLFLAGIASKLEHRRISHAVVMLAGASLLGASLLLITLPVALP